eukprot:gene40145-48922_t
MFGDLFSQNTDLQLGMMYSSRRKFLVSAGKNTLEPPSDFKTKKQARRSVLNSALLEQPPSLQNAGNGGPHRRRESIHGVPPLMQSNASKLRDILGKSFLAATGLPQDKEKDKDKEHGSKNSTFKNFRKTAQFVMEAVMIEHYWEGDKTQWVEEERAGVRYFINKVTGEVLPEAPWKAKAPAPSRASFFKRKDKDSSNNNNNKDNRPEGGDCEGTGSLVYDSSEVDELFRMLDQFDGQKSPDAKAQHRGGGIASSTSTARLIAAGDDAATGIGLGQRNEDFLTEIAGADHRADDDHGQRHHPLAQPGLLRLGEQLAGQQPRHAGGAEQAHQGETQRHLPAHLPAVHGEVRRAVDNRCRANQVRVLGEQLEGNHAAHGDAHQDAGLQVHGDDELGHVGGQLGHVLHVR